MGPSSFQEFDRLQENFAQASMEATAKPQSFEKVEIATKNAKGGRKINILTRNVSEDQARSFLVPQKASELLSKQPNLKNVPPSLQSERVLRENAHDVAKRIEQVDDITLIPILNRFIAGLDLDKLGRSDLVADRIGEKISILSLHKVIELIGKNDGTLELDLPEQVTSYFEVIRRIKNLTNRLSDLSKSEPTLTNTMESCVNGNEKWQNQDKMEEVVKEQEESFLASQLFRNLAGSNNYLKRAIQYSQLWEQEGLSLENVYHLSNEEITTYLQMGVRYFAWYTLLDNRWEGDSEDNYFDDFQAFLNTFTDSEDPNFLGKLIPQEFHQSLKSELTATKDALFE